MSSYKDISISELGITITGKTPSSEFPNDFGDKYLFITPSDNFDSKYISQTERCLSEEGLIKLQSKVLPPHSILVSCIGSAMGKISMNKGIAITNQQINAIIPNLENFDNDYIYYLLKNNYKSLRNAATGSTALPLLNKTDFDTLRFKVHSQKYHQEKIAAVLSALDDKIELNNRINTELEQMAKTLYDYWFVQFDFPDANGMPYKSSGGKMVYNEVLKREVPEGWRVNALSEINSELARGISPKYSEQEGIPVVNQRCIKNNTVDFSFCRLHDGEAKPVKRLIQIGDILVNSTGVGTLGRTAIVKWLSHPKITTDSHVTIVRPDSELVNPHFLGFSLLNKQVEIEGLGEGSTGQTELSRENLGKLNILLPKRKIQNKYSSVIRPIFEKMAINEQQNIRLSALRDWLLPMLMNGQAKVGDVCKTYNTAQVAAMAAEAKSGYKKMGNTQLKQVGEQDQKFNLWLSNQGLAARGEIDATTLRAMFDAMDDEDK
ncbi:MAG: restriction endonuclease subunit S [Bacteroidetes bacterium]|nr:restriction endonuclease subunit S [Bacteroidota bacterium]